MLGGKADTGDEGSWGARPPTPLQSSPPPLSLQRIRQLVCPAEDLAQQKRAGPAVPTSPGTSLLRLTELESHC